ncbi:MAG: pantoate--beta-alanine ligase [Cytophagales bacterium]|nr:pantoate--beta-alanine ligase [Cytophagales bacterium]
MQLFDSTEGIRSAVLENKKQGKTIGLVPTMGALHEGHLSLVRAARTCDVVIVSIFVNPRQFTNERDLKEYPRKLDGDLAILKGKCDLVFAPGINDIYGNSPVSSLDFGDLGSRLEGEFRPGHFNGVGLIVAKLFNIILPDYAYFGLKDLQQYLLIKQLVKDLSFPIKIIGCTTIREESGLAMSSRNLKLSEKGIAVASKIFEGLNIVKEGFDSGESIDNCRKRAAKYYERINGLEIEYLEFASEDLTILNDLNGAKEISVCIAAYVEGVRLIDNLYLRQ